MLRIDPTLEATKVYLLTEVQVLTLQAITANRAILYRAVVVSVLAWCCWFGADTVSRAPEMLGAQESTLMRFERLTLSALDRAEG